MADVIGSLIGGIGFSGNTIGAAIVKLRLDSDDYQRQLVAANGTTQASADAMGAHVSRFSGIARAGLAAAGVGIAAFAVNAVKAASDLGESLNKSNVIFEANAAQVQAWAAKGADAFGLSQQAALEAAGGFGAMLQTAGLAVDKSADMSEALVQLAGDMASFNNIDPTEALEKLRSGLAGEAEPLRRFGVFLSEAAVQQEAYRSGIAKVGSELTDAQKVQARYNLILEQTTKQQGDFQRTLGESLPNQLRAIKAEFQNVSAAVGKDLLPVLTDLLKIVKDILPFIQQMARGLHALSEAGGLVFGPIGVLIKAISGGIQPTDEMNKLIGQTLVNFEGMKQKAELAKDGVTNLTGAIDDLRMKPTKHVVEIEYRYQGFDPSKPGMSTSAQQR